jgi:hypothetical protein
MQPVHFLDPRAFALLTSFFSRLNISCGVSSSYMMKRLSWPSSISTLAFHTGLDPSWAIQSVVQISLATSKPSIQLNSFLSIDEVRMELLEHCDESFLLDLVLVIHHRPENLHHHKQLAIPQVK